ncbi:MAG: protease pro-enzyme activation domain-containing protein [Burkholderiales bacterium]
MMSVGRMLGCALLCGLAALAPPVMAAADAAPVALPGHTLAGETTAKAQRVASSAKAASEEPIILTIVLQRSDPAGFSQLLTDLADPLSPRYRKYLTPQEVAERYGPTQADFDAVASHFAASGFAIVEGSDNRMTLLVSGSRAAVESALHTRIGDFEISGRRFYANEVDPALPPEIARRVQSIVGLTDLPRPTPLNNQHQHEQWEEGCKGAHLGLLTLGFAGFFLFSFFEWPPLLAAEGATIIFCFGENIGYNLGHMGNNAGGGHGGHHDAKRAKALLGTVLPGVNLADGTGQTIGLVQYDTFDRKDVDDYLALVKLPASMSNNLTQVHVNGGAPLGAGANEVLLDLAVVMTVAQGAKYVVYDAPLATSFQALFNAAINGGSTVISNSWAYCESQTTLADVLSLESIMQTAAASGITVFNASGDSGSTCLDGSPNTVTVPASAPTSVAVGGSSMQSTDALTYGTETWWNGTTASPPSGQGGYGVSKFFNRPSYQNGFTASSFRSVPDVVASADPAHGIVICQAADGGCPNGKWYGGTSMTAPMWAAFTALMNQALGAKMGAANPALYSVANTTAYHNAASMGSDFAHVGLGSPNLTELFLKLTGQTAGLPDANVSDMIEFVGSADVAKVLPTGYPADGATDVIVRVTLRDANGNTVPGKTISLTQNAGGHAAITPVNTVTTVDNGTAVFKVKNASFENVTFTATDTTDGIVLAKTITIPFSPPVATTASINASPNIVLNDGIATTTITVTLQDALARPLPGKVVQLSQGGGRSVITGPNPPVTGANGQIQFTATNLYPEAVTYTAIDVTDGNLAVPGSGVVTFGGQGSTSCASGTLSAAPGFTLTPFATGFQSGNLFYGNVNWGCRGASFPGFAADGAVYVTNFIDGGVFRLPPEGGAATSGNRLSTLGPSLFAPVFGKDGKLYAARGATTGNFFTGAVVEINPVNGAVIRTVMPNLTCPTSLVVDPLTGDLFTQDSCFGAGSDNPAIWRISNPASATPTLSVYTNLPSTPTGWLAMAPDGTMFVTQNTTNPQGAPVLRISGTDIPGPPTQTPIPNLTALYWITVGEVLPNGAARSLIILDGVSLRLRLADITTDPPTFVDLTTSATGSGTIGPDGCLYLSTIETIYKLAPSSGGCGFATTSPAPALILTPKVSNLPQGSQLTLTAQFDNIAVPVGTPVTFGIGDANRETRVGTTDASGKATVTLTGRFAGVDGVLAFATIGAATYRSNGASITWSAGKHETSLTLNATQSGSLAGQSVPLRAALLDVSQKPAVPVVGATIQFTAGTLSCNAVTNASGNATCNVTPPNPGSRVVAATYAGNGTYLPSAASQSLVVTGPPSTTLASSAASVQVGTPFVLTASVTGTAPTGTVSFRNELVPLPNCLSVPLTGSGNTRTAQCTVSSLGVGSYALTAAYSGDGTNTPSSATIVQVVSANAGPPCGGFSDVDPASPFCPNVEWLKDRQVTLGCTAGLYCPDAPVSRLSMAAFMNRLGTAGTDLVFTAQAQPGAINLDAAPVVCQTSDFTVVDFPRMATVEAIVSAQGNADVSFVTETVASFDGGTTWAPLTLANVAGSASAGHWGNVRSAGTRSLDVGQAVRFGVRVGRGGLGGSGGVTASQCNVRALVGNRNPNYSPLDQ